MAKVFKCKMTKTVTVNIKADNSEAAQAWIDTHDFLDIDTHTSMYDVDYEDIVIGETDEEYVIDVSKE